MTRSFRHLLTLALLAFCAESMAQSYEYGQRQGYIFDQKYVRRISVQQAEKVISVPGFFEPLLSPNWGREVIQDSRVQRVGDRLILQFGGKPPLSLRDYTLKETKQSEGDSQKFRYIKSVRGYHLVGVEFGHDQPAFLLISQLGSEIYFVDTN